MPYIAPPRGGAIRNYVSVPKTALEENPEEFDPEFGYENDTEANQYKSYTDTGLYAVLFFLAFIFINKLKKQK